MILNEGLKAQDAPEDAKKGLKHIEVTPLFSGEDLYRFSSRKSPSYTPWWIRRTDFQIFVREWGDANKELRERYPGGKWKVGYYARVAFGVQQSWKNDMDLIIHAKVKAGVQIQAFIGMSRTQYHDLAPNGMTITLTGSPNVRQIYIPDISADRALTDVGRLAIDVMQAVEVESPKFWPEPC